MPRALNEAMNDRDTAAAKRAMDAMMTMKKIDIARIEAARAGDARGSLGVTVRLKADTTYEKC